MTYRKALKVILTLSFVMNLNVTGPARASEPASSQGAAEYVNMLRGRIAAIWALNWVLNNDRRPESEGTVLRDLIRVGFDLDVTSQFVIRRFWGRAKAEQRAEFKDLFTEYLVNTYATRFEQYRIGTLTVVASNRVAGGVFFGSNNHRSAHRHGERCLARAVLERRVQDHRYLDRRDKLGIDPPQRICLRHSTRRF